jgi:hypothetical protein
MSGSVGSLQSLVQLAAALNLGFIVLAQTRAFRLEKICAWLVWAQSNVKLITPPLEDDICPQKFANFLERKATHLRSESLALDPALFSLQILSGISFFVALSLLVLFSLAPDLPITAETLIVVSTVYLPIVLGVGIEMHRSRGEFLHIYANLYYCTKGNRWIGRLMSWVFWLNIDVHFKTSTKADTQKG